MPILQRYVLTELLRVFGLIVFGVTLLLIVVGVIGEAAKRGLGLSQIVQILPYVIPSLLPFTIPATFLLTVCVVYGRMAGDQEITAMKAAGINVFEVLKPAFVVGAMLSLGTFLLTDVFVPWGRGKIESVIATAMEDIFLDILRSHNQFHDASRGFGVTVQRIEGRRLIDPSFRYALEGGQTVSITAREGTMEINLQQQHVLLDLYEGHFETPTGLVITFDHETRTFPIPVQATSPIAPRNIAISGIRQELLTISGDYELLQQRRAIATVFSLSTGSFDQLLSETQRTIDRNLEEQLRRQRKLVTEIHSRIAMACGCFFFALVGSPFAIQQAKRQFLTTFALCFAPILLLYYPTILLTMNLSKSGAINPIWGMWIGNAGLAVAGIWILRYVLRH